jgi:hypothetical protein
MTLFHTLKSSVITNLYDRIMLSLSCSINLNKSYWVLEKNFFPKSLWYPTGVLRLKFLFPFFDWIICAILFRMKCWFVLNKNFFRNSVRKAYLSWFSSEKCAAGCKHCTAIFSRAKVKKFSGSTTWYVLLLVEILDRLTVAASNTIDQHFHKKYQKSNFWYCSQILMDRRRGLKFCV